jgi:hypothetical protein
MTGVVCKARAQTKRAAGTLLYFGGAALASGGNAWTSKAAPDAADCSFIYVIVMPKRAANQSRRISFTIPPVDVITVLI